MFRGVREDILEKIKLTLPEDQWARFGINKPFTATTSDQKSMARDVQAYKDERENKLAEERHRNAVFQKLQENDGKANSPRRKSSPTRKSPRSPKGKSPRSPTRKSPRSPKGKSPRSPTRKSPRSPKRNSPRSSRRSRRSRKSRSRSRGRM